MGLSKQGYKYPKWGYKYSYLTVTFIIALVRDTIRDLQGYYKIGALIIRKGF